MNLASLGSGDRPGVAAKLPSWQQETPNGKWGPEKLAQNGGLWLI
jgi:hypothetical protein